MPSHRVSGLAVWETCTQPSLVPGSFKKLSVQLNDPRAFSLVTFNGSETHLCYTHEEPSGKCKKGSRTFKVLKVLRGVLNGWPQLGWKGVARKHRPDGRGLFRGGGDPPEDIKEMNDDAELHFRQILTVHTEKRHPLEFCFSVLQINK